MKRIKRAFLPILLTLASFMAFSCYTGTVLDTGESPEEDGYRVTLSFVDSTSPNAVEASARTLVPYYDIGTASSVDILVTDSDTAEIAVDLSGIIVSGSTYSLTLPSAGPWDIVVTAYDSTPAISATGKLLHKTFTYDYYCNMQMVPPQSGGVGSLTYTINLYNLPADFDLATVTTTLYPVTVDALGIVQGTPVDLASYRVDTLDASDYSYITLGLTDVLTAGDYQLEAYFTYNSRTFYVPIDPVIRVCDNYITTGSASFDYSVPVPDYSLSFAISAPYDYLAIASKRAFVVLYDDQTYYKYATNGYDLYDTPYRTPIGVGMVDLDANGEGTATILDSAGDPLALNLYENYTYRFFVDTSNRYAAYASVTDIARPETLVAITDDYYQNGQVYKTGVGTTLVDPSGNPCYDDPLYIAADSATGTGDGMTYENAMAFSDIMALLPTVPRMRIFLVSDITSVGPYTIPGAYYASVEIWGVGDTPSKFLPSSPFSTGPLFTIEGGTYAYFYGVAIDGSNMGGSSAYPAIQTATDIFRMNRGSSISNMTLSSGDGAAINVSGASAIAEIQYTSFSGNTASAGNGGAIAITCDNASYPATLSLLSGVSLINNQAVNGGAVYIGDYVSGSLDFDWYTQESCMVMSGNTAETEGGGIYIESLGSLYAPLSWLDALDGYGYTSLPVGNAAGTAGTETYVNYGTLSDSGV